MLQSVSSMDPKDIPEFLARTDRVLLEQLLQTTDERMLKMIVRSRKACVKAILEAWTEEMKDIDAPVQRIPELVAVINDNLLPPETQIMLRLRFEERQVVLKAIGEAIDNGNPMLYRELQKLALGNDDVISQAAMEAVNFWPHKVTG